MRDLKASPLHLISAVINVARLHEELDECPIELTERCVHLLYALGKSRELAIQINYEMMELLQRAAPSCNDIGYMKLSRYFVRELLQVFGPQHKLWGAISYVMLSVTPLFPEGAKRIVWMRINSRLFEVLLDAGVISSEEERRLKAKSESGSVIEEPDFSFDEGEAPHTTESSASRDSRGEDKGELKREHGPEQVPEEAPELTLATSARVIPAAPHLLSSPNADVHIKALRRSTESANVHDTQAVEHLPSTPTRGEAEHHTAAERTVSRASTQSQATRSLSRALSQTEPQSEPQSEPPIDSQMASQMETAQSVQSLGPQGYRRRGDQEEAHRDLKRDALQSARESTEESTEEIAKESAKESTKESTKEEAQERADHSPQVPHKEPTPPPTTIIGRGTVKRATVRSAFGKP